MKTENWHKWSQNEIDDFQEIFLNWYHQEKRNLPWRANTNPYNIWISEIMLQQTRVDTVIGYYYRFMETFPTIKDLAEADEQKLLKVWEGLGYYSRARNLKVAAKQIMEDKGLVQISDEATLLKFVNEALDNNPQSVEDYKNGKGKAMGFLVGQIMKASKGQANPQKVNQLLKQELDKR